MAIDLLTFNSGDLDYIAKLNQNMAAIEAAIEGLQTQAAAAGAGTPLSAGMFLDNLFDGADGLIGAGSYKPTLSGTTATIAPGGMYLVGSPAVVTSFNNVGLNFTGQVAGTYYIVVDSAGSPNISATLVAGAVYSVVWTGSAFTGTPIRIVPALFDVDESDDARQSAALATNYASLDARLEAGETAALSAVSTANDAHDIAEDALALASATATVRKVGCTVDGTGGVKGAIQLDFSGTIIGWSVIADVVGDLQVEVSKAASSAPPAAPTIPNPTTQKISASAPIALSSAQSAARGTAGVSTWTTAVTQWDVIQFRTITVATLTKATLYLRIQETVPSP